MSSLGAEAWKMGAALAARPHRKKSSWMRRRPLALEIRREFVAGAARKITS